MPAIGERWRLLEQAVDCSFFQSWAWVGCLAEERIDRPVLIEAKRNGITVALALFNRALGRLWLGETGAPAWDSVFVEHNGALVAPGEMAALRSCLRLALRRAPRLMLNGLGERQTRAALATRGAVVAYQKRVAPHVDLLLDAGSYSAQLSANTRYQLGRSTRAYGELGPLRLVRATTPAEKHGFLDALSVLHQARWTARGKPGAFASPEFGRFHHALIDRSPGVDLLRINAGSHVIGYLHNFHYRGRVYAYQSGFDYAGAPTHGKPGMTSHQLAIEQARADGMAVYDFLAGDHRYKTSLATGAQSLHWLEMARRWSVRGVAGRLRRVIQRAEAPLSA